MRLHPRTLPVQRAGAGHAVNTRRFLAGTWTIWRTGGGLRLVVADLAAGVRWALKGWR